MDCWIVTGISSQHNCIIRIQLVSIQNAGLLPVVHAKHAIVAIYKVIPGSYLHIPSERDNCFYIATMQTGERRIRSKAMPPPNTNPMELDHVRVHVSNPFSRLSIWSQWLELYAEKRHIPVARAPCREKAHLSGSSSMQRKGTSQWLELHAEKRHVPVAWAPCREKARPSGLSSMQRKGTSQWLELHAEKRHVPVAWAPCREKACPSGLSSMHIITGVHAYCTILSKCLLFGSSHCLLIHLLA